MTALYLLGAPATGKSTTMRLVLDLMGLDTGEWFRIGGDFHGEPLEDIIRGENRGVYLGRNREKFPGTDALSMSAHKEAMIWAKEASFLPSLILGEGARLGTAPFLRALHERTALVVAYLEAPEEELNRRCDERGSTQALSFRRGAGSRARNAADQMEQLNAYVLRYDTTETSSYEIALNLVKVLA